MGSTGTRGAIFAQAAKNLKRRRKIVSRECTHEIIAELFLFMDFVKLFCKINFVYAGQLSQ